MIKKQKKSLLISYIWTIIKSKIHENNQTYSTNIFIDFCFKTAFADNGDTLTANPNIFDTVTVIHFEIGATDTISLNVFSATGQDVKTFFNDSVLSAGAYSLTFNADTLPNGIYFVKLKINSTTRVAKIIKEGQFLGVKGNQFNPSNLLLYPNPTTAELSIPFDGIKNVIVTDLSGRTVFNSMITTKSISLSDLDNGKYIVTVLSENKVLITTQQILKLDN